MPRAPAPDWPRMMRLATGAAYCDLTVAEFERAVAAGVLPDACTLNGEKRWSRSLLDEALAKLSGEGARDWRREQPLYQGGA